MHIRTVFLCSLFLLNQASFSKAEKQVPSFNVGFSIGIDDHRSTTSITRTQGVNPTLKSNYDDKYNGNSYNLELGHLIPTKWGFIDTSLIGSIFTGSYKRTATSSISTGKLRNNFGFRIKPGKIINEWLSCSFVLGVDRSTYHLKKVGQNTTSYNKDFSVLGFSLGLELSAKVSEKFSTNLTLTHSRYESIKINASHKPTGKNDEIHIRPKRTTVLAGIRYHF